MTAVLELKGVTKTYRGGLLKTRATVALERSYVSIGAGNPTITAIAGESGSGKTTMGMLLLGFITPTDGEILYKGCSLSKLSKPEWREYRRSVQAIFQDPFEVYNPFYKVDRMLDVPIAMFKLARSSSEKREMMESALRHVGLRPEETLGRYPHELSGGQRQRIMIARALLLQPQVIIADEPVSMIDASLRATVLKSLAELRDELGISILYITHDLATAYHISDSILILYQGSTVEGGSVETVIMDPRHPYTQLLVNSIPWPDPGRRWAGVEEIETGESAERVLEGCKFVPRCRHKMSMCAKSVPPLFQVGPGHAVACHLYRDNPMVEEQDLSALVTQVGRVNSA
jgi:oligopeptide/dipeptide ABC transporter ATP-binding protein